MENSQKVEIQTGSFFGEIFEYNSDKDFQEALELIGLKNFFNYKATGKIIADIGCGYGRTTYEFLKAGAQHVHAVDISPKQLERAKALFSKFGYNKDRVSFHHLSATELSLFEDNTFDVVVSLGVILIVPDFEMGLTELCRIVKPGGKLYFATLSKKGIIPFLRWAIRQVTTKIPYNWIEKILRSLPIKGHTKYMIADTFWTKYYHQHSLKELHQLLKERGFKITKVADVYSKNSAIWRFMQGEGYIHLEAEKNNS